MRGDYRLSPVMAKRKLAALAFIRTYIGAHGGSPSYGEIAAALGVPRQRVQAIVKALVADGAIGRTPATARSLTLPVAPTSIARAVELLRAAGFVVDDDVFTPGVTLRGLPLAPALDHYRHVAGWRDVPGIDDGQSDGAAAQG